MGISFSDLEKAKEFFHKHGMSAQDVEKEMQRLWKENNMSAKVQKAYMDLIIYGEGKIEITNIKEK